MTFLLRPTVLLGLLLALSLVGNGALYKLHTHDLQRIGSLRQAAQEARADAKACSDGVRKLREASAAREKETAKALKEAEARERAANEKADKTLQERPVNGDSDCGAALNLHKRKLLERHSR